MDPVINAALLVDCSGAGDPFLGDGAAILGFEAAAIFLDLCREAYLARGLDGLAGL